jgi:hypothetical protein
MENETKAKDNRDMAVRTAAIDFAIRCSSGSSYDFEGRAVTDPKKVVEAASMFEAFIKGA